MKERISKKMKEVESTSWCKLFEIKTQATTLKGMVNAVNKECNYFEDMEDEEIEKLFNSEWITICEDGIIIWADGVE